MFTVFLSHSVASLVTENTLTHPSHLNIGARAGVTKFYKTPTRAKHAKVTQVLVVALACTPVLIDDPKAHKFTQTGTHTYKTLVKPSFSQPQEKKNI